MSKSDGDISAHLNDLVVCARHILGQLDARALSAVVPAIEWAEGESKRLREKFVAEAKAKTAPAAKKRGK